MSIVNCYCSLYHMCNGKSILDKASKRERNIMFACGNQPEREIVSAAVRTVMNLRNQGLLYKSRNVYGTKVCVISCEEQ